MVPVEVAAGFNPAGFAQGKTAETRPDSADVALNSAAFGTRRKEEPQTLKDRCALPASAGSASLTGKKLSHYRVPEMRAVGEWAWFTNPKDKGMGVRDQVSVANGRRVVERIPVQTKPECLRKQRSSENVITIPDLHRFAKSHWLNI
jgi:hypothetical protein